MVPPARALWTADAVSIARRDAHGDASDRSLATRLDVCSSLVTDGGSRATRALRALICERRMVPPPRARRLVQLFLGLALYGVSDSMLLLAGLGLDPWDVLHQGLSRRIGLGVGTWAIIVGVAVLLAWIPLRQRPGIGTLCNVVLVGAVIDLMLAVVHPPHALASRVALLVGGGVLNGVATGAYIGAGLGPGPRDGLMTAWAARGHSIRVVRTTIEVSALAAGWALGGTVGVGTVLYALAIGPLAHRFIPLLEIRRPTPEGAAAAAPAATAGAAPGRPGQASDRTSTQPRRAWRQR